MTTTAQHTIAREQYLILNAEDYVRITPEMFGSPGVHATEVLGPYVDIQASGPLLVIHDGLIEPHHGIEHHPHRHNERIFYLESGQLDHDDARNGITGHIDTHEVGLFTEGKGGMVHSEWNHGDVPTHAFILVYSTDPVPDETALTVLPDGDMPRYSEGEGVYTKEMVGPRSPLVVHGDIRLFTESTLEADASLALEMGDGEGGLLAIREGEFTVDSETVRAGGTILAPPEERDRRLIIKADRPGRVLRAVHGPGHGFVRGRGRLASAYRR